MKILGSYLMGEDNKKDLRLKLVPTLAKILDLLEISATFFV